MARVTAGARVRSLAQELLYAVGIAKGKKKYRQGKKIPTIHLPKDATGNDLLFILC